MRTTPVPDLEGMVKGGESRLRHRNRMRIGLAAAAVLILGGGAFGVTQLGDNDGDPTAPIANQPTGTTNAPPPQRWENIYGADPAEAGTYRTRVGTTEAGVAIEADFTIDGKGWSASNYPVAFAGKAFAGFGVYEPESVAGGCQMEAGDKVAATTPQGLVQQLIRMPRSDVVQQPAPTEAFGGSAVHLQLRINAWCGGEPTAYLVAEGPATSRGISYFDGDPQGEARTVIIDFWVLDVDGTAVVVDRFHRDGAPAGLVAQSTRAVESIELVKAE